MTFFEKLIFAIVFGSLTGVVDGFMISWLHNRNSKK